MFRRKGKHYERLAEEYLSERGLRCLERNFSCRGGEIDLVMLEGGVLVFVEVRFRASETFGSPLESITRTKQQRLLHAAGIYLQRAPVHCERTCRFDVVGITGPEPTLVVRWIKDAFSA